MALSRLDVYELAYKALVDCARHAYNQPTDIISVNGKELIAEAVDKMAGYVEAERVAPVDNERLISIPAKSQKLVDK